MTSTSALVPHVFEGRRIRVSTDEQGEAWFVLADVCAALSESPMAWAVVMRQQGEHCLHCQEGPGAEGCTLALISEAALLRRLMRSESPVGWRLRRWLTHQLLPALQRRHQAEGKQGPGDVDAIRRQTVAETLSKAEEIIELTGVSHADALLAALAEIQGRTAQASAEGSHQCGELAGHGRERGDGWLPADQLAQRLKGTIRRINQRLTAAGLQQRNEDDEWQLTAAGRDWGITLPVCSRGLCRQQILWDPAVLALLEAR